jgi:hypothetical protein
LVVTVAYAIVKIVVCLALDAGVRSQAGDAIGAGEAEAGDWEIVRRAVAVASSLVEDEWGGAFCAVGW